MSNPVQMVHVTPPDWYQVVEGQTALKERTVMKGFVCPNCNGRKVFTDQTGHDTYKEKACHFCGGTGKLKATVEIVWSPDE